MAEQLDKYCNSHCLKSLTSTQKLTFAERQTERNYFEETNKKLYLKYKTYHKKKKHF